MANAAANLIELAGSNRSFYVPGFELRVKGAPLPRNAVRDVSEVTYEDATDRVDGFTLVIANWDDTLRAPKYVGLPKARLNEPNAQLFQPDNEIQLLMGYQGDLRLLMTGVITTLDVEFPEQGGSKLTVHGLNVLDRLRRKQYSWTWPDDDATSIRDSDVALALARSPDDAKNRPGLGIKVKVDPAAQAREPALPRVVMQNQYPIVFLLERARRRGYEITIDERKPSGGGATPEKVLYFGPTSELADVTYVLEWGKSLQSFRPLFSSARQLAAVTVCGFDRKAKKPIAERAELKDLPQADRVNADLMQYTITAGREDVVTDQPVNTQDEARKKAFTILREQQQKMVTCSGTTVGLPDLRAGRNAVIRGTGFPFDGVYFITGTRHTLGEQGYRTTFDAKRIAPEAGR
jgi:phage protein D